MRLRCRADRASGSPFGQALSENCPRCCSYSSRMTGPLTQASIRLLEQWGACTGEVPTLRVVDEPSPSSLRSLLDGQG